MVCSWRRAVAFDFSSVPRERHTILSAQIIVPPDPMSKKKKTKGTPHTPLAGRLDTYLSQTRRSTARGQSRDMAGTSNMAMPHQSPRTACSPWDTEVAEDEDFHSSQFWPRFLHELICKACWSDCQLAGILNGRGALARVCAPPS